MNKFESSTGRIVSYVRVPAVVMSQNIFVAWYDFRRFLLKNPSMTNNKNNPKEPFPPEQTPDPPQEMNPREPKNNGDHKRKAGGEPKAKKKKEKPGRSKPFHRKKNNRKLLGKSDDETTI